MAETFQSQTLSVSIRRDPQEVYEYVTDPANLPTWATAFCTSVRQAEGQWILETPDGDVTLRFVDANDFRVADHYLLASGVEVYVPMRIVPNGEGSEVLFTLFRQPGISTAEFGYDVGLVTRDLNRLKQILEG